MCVSLPAFQHLRTRTLKCIPKFCIMSPTYLKNLSVGIVFNRFNNSSAQIREPTATACCVSLAQHSRGSVIDLIEATPSNIEHCIVFAEVRRASGCS